MDIKPDPLGSKSTQNLLNSSIVSSDIFYYSLSLVSLNPYKITAIKRLRNTNVTIIMNERKYRTAAVLDPHPTGSPFSIYS